MEDESDWTGLWGTKLELRSHPQETSENSVDLGHFTEVHSFNSATTKAKANLNASAKSCIFYISVRFQR